MARSTRCTSCAANSNKLPLKLKFNEFEAQYPAITGQRFHGFKSLQLPLNRVTCGWPLLHYITRDDIYFARYKAHVAEFADTHYRSLALDRVIDTHAALVRTAAASERARGLYLHLGEPFRQRRDRVEGTGCRAPCCGAGLRRLIAVRPRLGDGWATADAAAARGDGFIHRRSARPLSR